MTEDESKGVTLATVRRRRQLNLPSVPSNVSLDSLCSGESDDTVASLLALGMSHVQPTTWEPDSPGSHASSKLSWKQFADPYQTLIFFDWDDTLFPTTELFDRRGFSSRGACLKDGSPLPEGCKKDLRAWAAALHQYLTVACSLSKRCVIVTNARRPWVTDCIERFAPNLQDLLEAPDGPCVVYAGEVLESSASGRIAKHGSLRPVRHAEDPDLDPAERDAMLTTAKYLAMRREAKKFYSRYPGQSWKNILSLGDMRYEHDAVQEVAFRRRQAPSLERLWTKTLILPGAPSLTEITLRLQFSRLMLPVYVHFKGDIDLNLRDEADPLAALARALSIPELSQVPFPRHAWGRTPLPRDAQEVEEALLDVAVSLQDKVID